MRFFCRLLFLIPATVSLASCSSDSDEKVLEELSTIKAELKSLRTEVVSLRTGIPPEQVAAAESQTAEDAPANTDAKVKIAPARGMVINSAPKTYSGKAGETIEKILLQKTSGAGTLKASKHLVNVSVDPAIVEPEARKITVKYTFEVLDDMRAMFYCARTSRMYYQRMGQGWWLQLSDGSRIQARRAGDRTAKRGKPAKPTKCVFKIGEDVDWSLTKKMALIYVPAGDMSGWPKDNLNRSVPQIVVDLMP